MKKIEYCVGGIDCKTHLEKQQEILNDMGGKGFELVAVVDVSKKNGYLYFYLGSVKPRHL